MIQGLDIARSQNDEEEIHLGIEKGLLVICIPNSSTKKVSGLYAIHIRLGVGADTHLFEAYQCEAVVGCQMPCCAPRLLAAAYQGCNQPWVLNCTSLVDVIHRG